MTSSASHIKDLQEILDSALRAAKENASSANIAAVGKARKALEEYQHASGAAGERFKTQSAALDYLQRTWRIEKSKLSKDVQDKKVPVKDGYFHAADLDFYAQAVRLEPKNSEQADRNDFIDDIKRESARKLRLANEEREGQLINKAEEEARDAKLWAAIKGDIESNGTAIVHELINRILPIVEDDDLRQRILALNHELRITYEDNIGEIFNRYAQNGGVEA